MERFTKTVNRASPATHTRVVFIQIILSVPYHRVDSRKHYVYFSVIDSVLLTSLKIRAFVMQKASERTSLEKPGQSS